MEHTKKPNVRVSRGWNDVVLNAMKTLVVAFVALLGWDWFESGDFDPTGVGGNAAVVALSLFLLDVILLSSRRAVGGIR